jgi:hypothetical protein
MLFYILKKVGIPCRDPEGHTCGPFSFVASSLLLSWPACKISFHWDCAFSGCITRCTFTSSRKLACPVETLRGSYVDPSHLQLLAFLHFSTFLPKLISLGPYILWLHHKMHFYIPMEVGTPCRDPKGSILGHFSFAAFSLLLSWPSCQVSFCWDCAYSGCITRCTFTSCRRLAHPVETPRGPYEVTSLLQHLLFYILTNPQWHSTTFEAATKS